MTIRVKLSVDDGLSALHETIRVAQYCGGSALEFRIEDVSKCVSVWSNGNIVLAVLPSPVFLRLLADRIEAIPETIVVGGPAEV